MLGLPEVQRAQAEADAGVWNLDRPVLHHNLVLLHHTRRPSLPANHKLTGSIINTVQEDAETTVSAATFIDFDKLRQHLMVS